MSREFFESDVPPELDAKVERAAQRALRENQRQFRRRRVLQWFWVPALAALFAAIFGVPRDSGQKLMVAEFLDWNDVSDEDFDAISELDLLDDLDVLQKWEDA